MFRKTTLSQDLMSLLAFFQNSFLEMAVYASLLASIASGTIGSFVVIKRISFIAGSISHSILGGIGLSVWLSHTYQISWMGPLTGAFLAAILSSLLIGWIHIHYRQREDAVIASIWSIGMASGIIFLSLTPSANVEIMDVLFGNILWTTSKDLLILGALDLCLLGVVFFYYHQFLSLCFDEEQTLLRGISTKKLYLILLCLVGISIVLLIQIIGAILVLALLIIPSTIANLFTSRLLTMIGISIFSCALISLLGMGTAYAFNWPPGSTIALLAALSYFLILPLKKKKNYI